MKTDFGIAFHATMSHEGQYSNDPRDRGGETWMGIARKINPFWSGWPIIDQIKSNANQKDWSMAMNADDELFEHVKSFYKAFYWDALNLDNVIYQEIADELFDTAVNQGTGTAGRYLQEALNLLNSGQKHYKNIEPDGKIGNGTLTALKSYFDIPGRSEERSLKTIIKVLNGLQFCKYKDICKIDEGQEAFLFGWMNRVG